MNITPIDLKENSILEEAILGACLIETGIFPKVQPLLNAGDFQSPFHKKVWGAMEALAKDGTAIDIATVSHYLKGNAYEVTMLTSKINQASNVLHHAYCLKQNSLSVQLGSHAVEIGRGLINKQDPFELLALIQKNAEAMTKRIFAGRTVSFSDTVDAEIDLIINAMQTKVQEPRTMTGFKAIDEIMNGLKKGDLLILAARPAMGKTALALNIASNVLRNNGRVAMFSLEMTRSQLLRRLLASEARVLAKSIDNAHALSNNDAIRLTDTAAEIRDWRMLVDDNASATVLSIRSQCMQFKNTNNGIDLVVIDYLQLMQEGGERKSGNREQEISAISRGLKVLAKDLECPVIALSQLSRNCENRPDKRPMLSDLRESGAIEQDADAVAFVFRPEVYFEEDEDGESTKGKAEIILAKHRNGETGTAHLQWWGPYMLFTDVEA